MAYQGTLNGTQTITISNRGKQTQVTLLSSSFGQQQSQSSSFTTGEWQAAPQLFATTGGFILQIAGEQSRHSILIQSNSIQASDRAIEIDNARAIELKPIDDPPEVAPPDFAPMQPMRMGNMSMDINSMSMQMGNMSLNMGKQAKEPPKKVFCSQCGTLAKENARFCHSCGWDLSK